MRAPALAGAALIAVLIAVPASGAGVGAEAGAGIAGARADAAEAAASLDLALTGELTQGGWAHGMAPQGAAALSLDGQPIGLAPDGRFLLAFDRDAAPQARLAVRFADGRTITRSLTIAPRAWQIERVGVGLRPGATPSAEWAARRAGELAQIKAARSLDHPVQGWRQAFIWPVHGRLSGRFGAQRIYNGTPGSYHSGLDIATGTGGTPFVAPADGVVILAAQSPFSLEGRLLMIDHGMGLNSAFLHCSELAVRTGDIVRQGQYIGRIGATGRATGPHLHWSIKWRDARLDPLLFAGAMPAR